MVESRYVFSQEEHDRKMGLSQELCGQITQEAQMARFHAQVEQGIPEDMARQNLGLTEEDFQVAALEVTQE